MLSKCWMELDMLKRVYGSSFIHIAGNKISSPPLRCRHAKPWIENMHNIILAYTIYDKTNSGWVISFFLLVNKHAWLIFVSRKQNYKNILLFELYVENWSCNVCCFKGIQISIDVHINLQILEELIVISFILQSSWDHLHKNLESFKLS